MQVYLHGHVLAHVHLHAHVQAHADNRAVAVLPRDFQLFEASELDY